MRKISLLLMTVMMALAVAGGAPEARANGELDQILNNMQKAAQKLTSLHAYFSQEKQNTQLGGRAEKYNGEILFKRAGRGNEKVRLNYTNTQAVSVIGNEIVLYQPQINQAIITTRQKAAGKNPEFSFVATPYSSVPQLKANYHIEYLGDENVGGTATAKLKLTPKAKSSIKEMIFWVDRGSWMPIKFEVQDQTSKSTLTLNNVKPNPGFSDARFKIDFASGTNVIKQ